MVTIAPVHIIDTVALNTVFNVSIVQTILKCQFFFFPDMLYSLYVPGSK